MKAFDWNEALAPQSHVIAGVGQTPIVPILDELQARPGEWALIYSNVSDGMIRRYKKLGCEVLFTPESNKRGSLHARWPGIEPAQPVESPLSLRLYNASLTSRGLPSVDDWTCIHSTVRAEFEAIAEAAQVEIQLSRS